MGGGSVCLLETVARAGSLAGTYAWSVWLLSPAGHLWAGCSAQLAGWLIAAAFRRKVVRSKTISSAKRFRPSCSGRMAHSCPAYDTDRTPILEIWQIFRSSTNQLPSWRLFRFVQGFGILTDPGIGSLREPARAIDPSKQTEPPPISLLKKTCILEKNTGARGKLLRRLFVVANDQLS